MIHSERTRDIDAPVDAVWQFLGRFMEIGDFHPTIVSVEPLTSGEPGEGAMRRCNFKDGSSVVEEVTEWEGGRRYRVRLSEYAMPLKRAFAEFSLEPMADGKTRARMAMDYDVKFGPVGWLMGQTMIKSMTGKLFDAVLGGLAGKAEANAERP